MAKVEGMKTLLEVSFSSIRPEDAESAWKNGGSLLAGVPGFPGLHKLSQRGFILRSFWAVKSWTACKLGVPSQKLEYVEQHTRYFN